MSDQNATIRNLMRESEARRRQIVTLTHKLRVAYGALTVVAIGINGSHLEGGPAAVRIINRALIVAVPPGEQ